MDRMAAGARGKCGKWWSCLGGGDRAGVGDGGARVEVLGEPRLGGVLPAVLDDGIATRHVHLAA